jgi:hypothetical protein
MPRSAFVDGRSRFMKNNSALIAMVFAGLLAACSPEPDVPQPGPVPLDPPVTAGSTAAAEAVDDLTSADPWALTPFTPPTNEIYCGFYKIGDDGMPSDRVFITEIAGVPAPAAVGLQGQAVTLTEISKAEDAAPQVWIYGNPERALQVELNVTETNKGFESRDYEGTIQVTQPAEGQQTAITGTCGV